MDGVTRGCVRCFRGTGAKDGVFHPCLGTSEGSGPKRSDRF
ncbi:hypothetical protein RISK_006548 [Rhodopirellula islandica]|uniref:Uncharacterized protein n=1 Tax=Rhodopirellula islandica TaxID=595434 RepID=A0A0J1B3R7_RHOIS|nr:hypothetical protein RISK_006548 [Rhodopirellula islandica]